ncbi:enoyl-CoA isomerase, putative, partial [Ixodes scapularis]
ARSPLARQNHSGRPFCAGRTLLSTFGESRRRSLLLSRRSMSYNFETLAVSTPADHVFHVEINRPEKMNAMNAAFWEELPKCFQQLHNDKKCRVVVISGAGKMFTAGLDFKSMMNEIMQQNTGDGEDPDVARKARHLYNFSQMHFIVALQCSKPVIAAVHNGCIGGGVNLITACDMRYCTSDAYFQIKEVELGLAADVGVLQRLPRVIGNRSLVSELVFTGRRMEAAEAREAGLVSRIFPDKAQMLSAAVAVAKEIASKSPVAVQGSKVNLVFSRDHGVDEALHFMACWNMSMLQSEDVVKSVMALMEKAKEPPKFANL